MTVDTSCVRVYLHNSGHNGIRKTGLLGCSPSSIYTRCTSLSAAACGEARSFLLGGGTCVW